MVGLLLRMHAYMVLRVANLRELHGTEEAKESLSLPSALTADCPFSIEVGRWRYPVLLYVGACLPLLCPLWHVG